MEPTTINRELTANQLVSEIGSWAEENFSTRRPMTALLGIVEEIGEAAHAVLKHDQKIRGYDNEEYFHLALEDALADAVIYICDFVHQKGTYFSFVHNDITMKEDDELRIVAFVQMCLSALWTFESTIPTSGLAATHQYSVICQRLITALGIWANYHHIDLQKAATETWCRTVSKRNWKKNPTNADKESQS